MSLEEQFKEIEGDTREEWIKNAKESISGLPHGCSCTANEVIQALNTDIRDIPEEVQTILKYHPDGCPECKSELISMQHVASVTADLDKCTVEQDHNPGCYQIIFICGDGCGWTDTVDVI